MTPQLFLASCLFSYFGNYALEDANRFVGKTTVLELPR
jgi:hypothetical protein